jgi:hypothetical protein
MISKGGRWSGECGRQLFVANRGPYLPLSSLPLPPFLSTLTNTQTLWSDLAGYAGRDSASMKTREICWDKTLLVLFASC